MAFKGISKGSPRSTPDHSPLSWQIFSLSPFSWKMLTETLLQEGSSQLHGPVERTSQQQQPMSQVCIDAYNQAIYNMATAALHN